MRFLNEEQYEIIDTTFNNKVIMRGLELTKSNENRDSRYTLIIIL